MDSAGPLAGRWLRLDCTLGRSQRKSPAVTDSTTPAGSRVAALPWHISLLGGRDAGRNPDVSVAWGTWQ